MELIPVIGCIILAFCCTLLGVQLHTVHKQSEQFCYRLQCLQAENYRQPLKVDRFDADTVMLATALNATLEQYQSRSDRLARENRHLKEMIAGISHDFRTPLTAIKGYLQMLGKSSQLSSQDISYLKIISEKTEYLRCLSNDFFEISALEADQNTPMATDTVNLNNFLSDTILSQYPWISEHQIQTDFSIPEESILLQTNRHYLQRMMDNLFSNAQKYTVSSIGLSLSKTADRIFITVSNDTRSNPIDLKHIFDPFYHTEKAAAGTGHPDTNSSGLGLYVVKCLAEHMNYTVTAKQKAHRFCITLEIPTENN